MIALRYTLKVRMGLLGLSLRKKMSLLFLEGSQMCFCWVRMLLSLSQVVFSLIFAFPSHWVGIIQLTSSHSAVSSGWYQGWLSKILQTTFDVATCRLISKYFHPWRLTWNIIMEVWKIIFLSKWVICRFHVNLSGCKIFLCWVLPSPQFLTPLGLQATESLRSITCTTFCEIPSKKTEPDHSPTATLRSK